MDHTYISYVLKWSLKAADTDDPLTFSAATPADVFDHVSSETSQHLQDTHAQELVETFMVPT